MSEAARDVLGADRIVLNRQCIGVDQSAGGVTLRFCETSTGAAAPEAVADVAVTCDGINSAIRRQFYPDERVAFAGINTWRGVTRRPPILSGRTYMRIGSIWTGKLVVYPIVDKVDDHGNQLINWMAEIQGDCQTTNDWNKSGRLANFFPLYRDWTFDWLDVAALLRDADAILEYPMVDKDLVGRWTFGRVTLAGDAARTMYPRGSNGAAQALIDVRTLAELLAPAIRSRRSSLRGRTARTDGAYRPHQPRTSARFHQHPRRGADR